MEKELTIKQLIKRTYLKIIWQFLLCLILFLHTPRSSIFCIWNQ